MAGDWIKMRGNLWDDPRVSNLCDTTGCPEAQIIGGLYWLWATADQHTEDGIMPGLTLRQIDRKTGIQGFGAALCAIGWLADHPEGVRIIKFEEHNGTSAKRRCSEAQRKANARNPSASDADNERTESGSDAELEKEKRREEKKQKAQTAAARFERFWAAYPNKAGKQAALKAFSAVDPEDELLETILRAVEIAKASKPWQKDDGEFIPHASTYLNGKRWEDGGLTLVAKAPDDWRNDPRFKGAK